MLASTKHPPKYLKKHKEPEQLDLFGQTTSPESTLPDGYACLSTAVYSRIINMAGALYSLNDVSAAQLRNFIVHRCVNEPPSTAWHDYLMGMASTMSFLPTPHHQTFSRSDRAALASDWSCVQSDLNQVWQAIILAERYCHERTGQQRERQTEAAE
jgi:hypothetical protein